MKSGLYDPSSAELIGSGQKLFDAHRKFADADTGSMVDGAGDGGGDAGKTDLSDAARPKRVEHQVGVIEKSHVDQGRVGIGGEHVVGEVVVDGRTVAQVVASGFKEGHADAHHYGSFYLIAGGPGVENAAGIDDSHNARNSQASYLRLPGDFGELRAEGVR